MYSVDAALAKVLQQRRQKLGSLIESPVLLWAGRAPSKNFLANQYSFRASSHFLYFAGLPIQGAAICLHQGQVTLLMEDVPDSDALWHGVSPTRQQIAEQIGAIAHYPLSHLPDYRAAATIPVQDLWTRSQQSQVLGRSWQGATDLQGIDRDLAEALVQLRLVQDESAISAIQAAATVTVRAHQAGIRQTHSAHTEAQVRAAMESVLLAENMTTAYTSIVTVQGEVLHNLYSHRKLQPGDLLLADVGAEHPLGWAADVTRTWPVSGQWSATQRAIYDVVLAAHDACIAAIAPGVEYAAVHLTAARVIAAGLVDLGILKGDPTMLVERGVHALFFPHGVGHLLGLDVHDMEDLGDLAGYAPGRTRSDHCGMQYLRLHRPLQAGMVVTIEPGFYQVPAILGAARQQAAFEDCVNWERLATFEDVRGIRIEDDVWVTPKGPQVLTAALPTQADEIVQLMHSSPVG